ncbi:MAG: SgcJ/EcaC family oxidoreductase [Acidimicrobiales bacterium]
MVTISPSDAPNDVVRALLARVTELERSQRDEDVDGFLSLFDPDAVWVTGGGRRLIGLEAIAEFTQNALPGAFADGGSVDYVVEHVSFLDDDVVMTGVRQQYLDADGTPTANGLPTYVWRRGAGTWRIVVGQNTTVPDQA